MRVLLCLPLLGLSILAAGCSAAGSASPPPLDLSSAQVRVAQDSTGAAALEVTGKTVPVPGRVATIAPVVLHPVIEVKVKPGDRVKKDQVLVKIDDDEPQADVRAKKAALAELKASLARLKAQPREEERAELMATLESVKVSARDALSLYKRMEIPYSNGTIPETTYQTARATLLKLEADQKAAAARLQQLIKRPIPLEIAEMEARIAAAQAGLEASQAELEHYTVTAVLDGVIGWLEVNTGTVSRPGTSVWGEILDLREIDVRCDLTPEQADGTTVGQAAQVVQTGRKEPWAGEVVFVGLAADPKTGRVPVRVRVKDAHERLRCYIEVKVRFQGAGGS